MGIAIHNLSASGEPTDGVADLTAAVRQTAAGILGTTVQMADLVRGLTVIVTRIVSVFVLMCSVALCFFWTTGNPFRRRRVHVHWRSSGSANVRRCFGVSPCELSCLISTGFRDMQTSRGKQERQTSVARGTCGHSVALGCRMPCLGTSGIADGLMGII